MKNFYALKTLLVAFVLSCFAVTAGAEEITFDFAANEWGLTLGSGNGETAAAGNITAPIEKNGVSLTFNQGGEGVTPPRMWNNKSAGQLRLYCDSQKGSNTMTVTAPTGSKVTKVVFTSTQGTLAVNETAVSDNTWSGDAESICFVVTKSIRIDKMVITLNGEGGGETPVEPVDPTPVDPVDPTPGDELSVLFSEPFDTGIGNFSLENKTLPEGLTYVWKHDSSNKYMKASAYNKGVFVTESWLVSPVIDLSKATDCTLSFVQMGNQFKTQSTGNTEEAADNMKSVCAVKVKAEGDTEWTNLTLDAWPTGKDWSKVTSTATDFAAFSGKKVQIAFAYSSTTEICGTWEILNVEIKGKGEAPVVTPEVTEYTSIAAMKAAATANGENIAYKFNDLLVTGVAQKGKNYSVYVTDGTDGMQFYGPNVPNVKKGDKISGSVTGSLVAYNTLTEISAADYTEVSVTSSDNAVTPVAATLVDVKDNTTKTYENLFVRLEGISFAASALENSNITMLDESDNELTLRDNYGVLGDFIFDETKTYNVTAVVVYYGGNPQLYPLSADDVEMITNLLPAETAWAAEEVAIEAGEAWTVDNALTTATDGAKTFTSSNEAVATVAEDGTITVTGYGHTTITVETAETAAYLASKASFELYVIEGKGTLAEPYSIADAAYFNGKVTDKVWVKGIIGGSYVSNKFNETAAAAVATNIALGTAEQNLPVQLPAGDVRAALNIKDNTENLGKTVWLYGNIETYFNVTGLKNVTDYSFDGQSGVTAIDGVSADTKKADTIYSLDGRRVQQPVSGLYIVNGKKVFVK